MEYSNVRPWDITGFYSIRAQGSDNGFVIVCLADKIPSLQLR
jgi:hypothetical protein